MRTALDCPADRGSRVNLAVRMFFELCGNNLQALCRNRSYHPFFRAIQRANLV
jgi:hypothetical protein